jgi:acetate kinase
MFALPAKLHEAGVIRYGFHGLSYEYIASTLPDIAPESANGKVVVLHLGNGASMCAMENGRSIATTMGFTGVDGLCMGTRCGSLDPGVILHLMDQHGMSVRDVEELIYKKSGLSRGVGHFQRYAHAACQRGTSGQSRRRSFSLSYLP